jgi:hypothetical protein
MSDTTGELQFEHQWARVIIPYQEGYELHSSSRGSRIPTTRPVLCAHCNVCDKYFTSLLYVSADRTAGIGPVRHEGNAGLPRFGCIDPRIGRGI